VELVVLVVVVAVAATNPRLSNRPLRTAQTVLVGVGEVQGTTAQVAQTQARMLKVEAEQP